MEHKTVTTQTQPTTDLGQFEAIAAAWTEDRERDVIHRGAFTRTIKNWRRSGKRLPLHWDHKGDPKSIIGHIDPQSMRETDDGLFVKGQIDLENSELGREAWRSIKNGVVGLSFGYLATEQFKREHGGRDLHAIDMFEVSITPAPMHPDTRILSTKGLLETKVSDTPHREPFSSSRTSNWVARRGGLPAYVQNVAHDLMEKRGMDESHAISMAIGIMKRWCRGGGNVSAATRAKACAASAHWDAMKAAQANRPGKAITADNADNVPDAATLADYIDQLDPQELLDLFEAICSARMDEQDQPRQPEESDQGPMDMMGPGKSVEAQRKQADDVALEHASRDVPLSEAKTLAPGEPEPTETDQRLQALGEAVQALTEEVQRKNAEPPPDLGELRKHAHDTELEFITDTDERQGTKNAELQSDEPSLQNQFNEIRTAIAALATEIEESRKDPRPLRQRAEAVEREFVAGDEEKVPEPEPDESKFDDRFTVIEDAIAGLSKKIDESRRDPRPLRKRADDTELQFVAGDEQAKPQQEAAPDPQPVFDERFATIENAITALSQEVRESHQESLRKRAHNTELAAITNDQDRRKQERATVPEPASYETVDEVHRHVSDKRFDEIRDALGTLSHEIEQVRKDPRSLRQRADDIALDFASDGQSARKHVKAKEPEEDSGLSPIQQRLDGIENVLGALSQRLAEGEKTGHVPPDLLRKRADAVALEWASDGESLRKSPPKVEPPPPAEPELSLRELRRQMADEMLTALVGDELNE